MTTAQLERLAVEAVDYSYRRYDPDTLHRAGIKSVGRYIAIDAEHDGRDMSRAEFLNLTLHDISVWLIGERGAGNGAVLQGGYANGHLYGQYYKLCAAEYPWPTSRPIYLATDVDVASWQLPNAIEHYRGFADGVAPHPPGAYGGRLLLRALRDELGFRYLYNSNASYWDHGVPPLDDVDIQQGFGGPLADTDHCTCYSPDWGQFPITDPKELDMGATPEEITNYIMSPAGDKFVRFLSGGIRNEIVGDSGNDPAGSPDVDFGSVTLRSLAINDVHQQKVQEAILRKLEIPFHYDNGILIPDA